MNFEDEPYVRLYTRRSVTNRRLGWEGRAVMHEMLYEFDRAGVFELNGEAQEAIELVTGLPAKIVRLGLARLLKLSVWEVRGGHLVWPRFLEAQSARRSDRARQAEARARRRDGVIAPSVADGEPDVTPRDGDVTPRDVQSQPVTRGHEMSRASRNVTPSIALPSSALPSNTITRSGGLGAGDPPSAPVEDPGRETVCPLDLYDRAEKVGLHAELAEKLPCPIDSLRYETREFVKYWTIGAGTGRRRSGWMRRLRQRLVERHGEGKLVAPGALEHSGRGGRTDEPGRKSSLSEADRKELAKMGVVL